MISKKPALGIVVLCIMISATSVCADYIMMCTYFDNPVARVYRVGDDGSIMFQNYLTVGGNPESLRFSPNGKWGLIGSNTTTYPPTQKTIVLNVDRNREISVAGSVFNDVGELVAISPDSRWGVHGADLKTIRRYSNGTFTAIPCENPIYAANAFADFSSLNGYIYCKGATRVINEHYIGPDGVVRPTGDSVNISPSSAALGIRISPDGKTGVILSISEFHLTSLRIMKEGGMSLVQQFNVSDGYPYVVKFTPDSKYAIVTFMGASFGPDLRCFRINSDSTLSEVGSVILPDNPSGNMDITSDGKYIVTVELPSPYISRYYVVCLHDDGTLEYLPDKTFEAPGHCSSIAFVPPQVTDAEPAWSMYE